MKVLIVEDDFIIQIFLEKLILDEGCEVVACVPSSDEALHCVETYSPNLIFMDIGISGAKNGIETAKIINDVYKVPLVFMTGASDKDTLDLAEATNPIHILFKPIDDVSFSKELKRICDNIKKGSIVR